MKRRSFLALLGMSPLAAKAAAEDEALKLTSLGRGRALVGHAAPSGIPQDWDLESQQRAFAKMGDHIRLFGLPKFADDSARERSKHVDCLDVDIVAKRSWSLAVKVQHQQQRNYEQIVEQYRRAGWCERAHKTFSDAFGFKWQW